MEMKSSLIVICQATNLAIAHTSRISLCLARPSSDSTSLTLSIKAMPHKTVSIVSDIPATAMLITCEL